MRDRRDFAGLSAVQIQEEDVVAPIERRAPPMGQNDEVIAGLVGELTDLAGPEVQDEVALVPAAPAAEEHQVAVGGEDVLMEIEHARSCRSRSSG